jgi:hypothetical protein
VRCLWERRRKNINPTKATRLTEPTPAPMPPLALVERPECSVELDKAVSVMMGDSTVDCVGVGTTIEVVLDVVTTAGGPLVLFGLRSLFP